MYHHFGKNESGLLFTTAKHYFKVPLSQIKSTNPTNIFPSPLQPLHTDILCPPLFKYLLIVNFDTTLDYLPRTSHISFVNSLFSLPHRVPLHEDDLFYHEIHPFSSVDHDRFKFFLLPLGDKVYYYISNIGQALSIVIVGVKHRGDGL